MKMLFSTELVQTKSQSTMLYLFKKIFNVSSQDTFLKKLVFVGTLSSWRELKPPCWAEIDERSNYSF